MKKLPILFLLIFFLFGFSIITHKNITDKAFDYLPEMMDGFRGQFQSPVVNSLPPYYMLPDMEVPGHTLEKLAALTEQYYHILVVNLNQSNIAEAEKNIGRIAHCIGDAVSPTQNDPRTWGEIDDYYDLQIADPYFDQITVRRLDQDGLTEIKDIRAFTLHLCQQSASRNDYLIDMYNQYKDAPQTVFEKTKSVFDEQISFGIKALEDVLYSAWIEAGRPDYEDEPDDGGCSYTPIANHLEENHE